MMWPIITLATGLVIGFISGWLVRDYLTTEKRLLRPDDDFDLGIPGVWYQQQQSRQSSENRAH